MHRLVRHVILIALFAVVLRAIIPMGYMPDFNSRKTFRMTICSMDGPKTVTVDSKFSPVQEQHKEHAKDTCPFSVMHHSPFNVDVAGFAFDAPYQVSVQQRFIARDQFVRTHVYHSVAQPRAPPVIV